MAARDIVPVIPMVPGLINWITYPAPIPERLLATLNAAGGELSAMYYPFRADDLVHSADGGPYWAAAFTHIMNALIYGYHYQTLGHFEDFVKTLWVRAGIDDNGKSIYAGAEPVDGWRGARIILEIALSAGVSYIESGDEPENRNDQLRLFSYFSTAGIVLRNVQMSGGEPLFDPFAAAFVQHLELLKQRFGVEYAMLTN